MAEQRLSTLRSRIEMDTVDFNDSMTKINRELKILRNEYKLARSETQLFDKSAESLGNELGVLEREHETLNTAVKKQSEEYKKARAEFAKTQEEQKKAGREISTTSTNVDNQANKLAKLTTELSKNEVAQKNLREEIAKADSALYQWGDKLQSGGTLVENFGKGLDTFANEWMKLSGAMLLGVGGVVKAAIDFESSWTGVLKTTDGSPEQLARLQQGIRDMALEIPMSANEINSLAEAAGQLGIGVDDALGFTEVMANLGVSTSMSAETAATELARLANITGMSHGEFENLGSAIVDLGNNYATTESEISTMSLRLAAAGTQIGLEEADILGLAAALSSLGIESEAGGSAISKLMINMDLAAATGLDQMVALEEATGYTRRELELMASNNNKDFKSLADAMGMTTTEMNDIMKASKNLENFAEIAGMSGEEFQKAFGDDAIGTMQAFIDGLGGIDTESESAIEKLDAMGISEIRLRDALLRLAGNSELVSGAVQLSNDAWEENVALQDEADLRYGTTESQLVLLKNKLTDVAISAGQELLPTLIDLVDSLEPLIEGLSDGVKWFAGLNDETKELVIGFGGFLMVGGPVLKVIAGLTTNTGKAMKGVGGLFKSIFELNKATPGTVTGLGKIVLGLGGMKTILIGGAIVGGVVLLSKALGDFSEKQDINKTITQNWGDVVDEETGRSLLNFQTMSQESSLALEKFNTGATDSTDGVIGAYSDMGSSIRDQVEIMVGDLEEGFDDVSETIQKKVRYTIADQVRDLEALAAETETIESKITGIMSTASAERRSLTEGEMAQVEHMQTRLLEIQAEIAASNAEQQNELYEGMSLQIATMSEEQLKAYVEHISEMETLREEDREKELTQLQKYLDDKMITEEDYQAEVARIEEESLVAKKDNAAKIFQIEKARGKNEGQLNTAALVLGFERVELEEHWANMIADSRKGTIEITEDMTEAQKIAAQTWNSTVFNPITGEVTTNVKEAIKAASEGEEDWAKMVFMMHNAPLESNVKAEIKEALTENGRWNDLTFNEQQAFMYTNAKTTAMEYMQASGQWDELKPEEKTAFLDTNTPDQLVQILKDFGTWDKLNPRMQKFLATTNATEKATEAETAVNKFNRLHPTTHTLEVDTNAWNAVSTYNQAMQSVNGKTVYIDVSLNRSSMSNALDGIQAIGYAKGTNFHPGGLAVLGDGGKNEPYLTPQGHMGVSPDTDTLFSLPRGTKVWSSMEKFRQEARQRDILKPLLNKLPHFSEGTSKSFLDNSPRQEQRVSSDSFNIYITANGDLPDNTIKKMASKIEREIKNINDRRKISIGKGVAY